MFKRFRLIARSCSGLAAALAALALAACSSAPIERSGLPDAPVEF
jgi:hypothetical protein